MRRNDIDYRDYDPANFAKDHPDDQVLAEARREAESLASQLRNADLQGSPESQEREIEQRFDDLQGRQWDAQQQQNQLDRKDELHEYTNEKTDAIYDRAQHRVAQAETREGQVAAWEGTKQEVDRTRENAPNDPEFKERQEQLTHFQAARSEAASEEIHQVQQSLLRERGLDQTPEKPPEPPSQKEVLESSPSHPSEDTPQNAQHLPEDVMEKAAERQSFQGSAREEASGIQQDERLARAREAYEKAGTPPEPSQERSEDREYGRSR